MRPPRFGDAPAVLVATDRASRGIDAPGVGHVVLFEFPRDPSEYVRRAGRTARGATGRGTVSLLVLGRQARFPLCLTRNLQGIPSPTRYPSPVIFVFQKHDMCAARGATSRGTVSLLVLGRHVRLCATPVSLPYCFGIVRRAGRGTMSLPVLGPQGGTSMCLVLPFILLRKRLGGSRRHCDQDSIDCPAQLPPANSCSCPLSVCLCAGCDGGAVAMPRPKPPINRSPSSRPVPADRTLLCDERMLRRRAAQVSLAKDVVERNARGSPIHAVPAPLSSGEGVQSRGQAAAASAAAAVAAAAEAPPDQQPTAAAGMAAGEAGAAATLGRRAWRRQQTETTSGVASEVATLLEAVRD